MYKIKNVTVQLFLIIGITGVNSADYWFQQWDKVFDELDSFLDKPTEFQFPRPDNNFDGFQNQYSEDVQFLTNVINQVREQAQIFELPTNAQEYRPFNEYFVTELESYDFIIIGAGPGGSILANRLTEVPEWNVLLIEAGGLPDNVTDIPNMYFEVEYTQHNWGFLSTPQSTACLGMTDRICPLARGRGLGGTTLINGLVYARGSSIDFDRWSEQVGDSRWSYSSVLPIFKRTERFVHRDKEAPIYEPIHGRNGFFNVEHHLPRSPQLNAWLNAHKELGYPIADYNAGTGLGAAHAQLNTRNGRTEDAGTSFLFPILSRPNLKILLNSYVTKILIDKNKRAYGVVFTHEHKVYVVKASKEIILSAGAFQTPQILMLSGIGPRNHLETLDIPVKMDLEVGSSLMDHACYYGLNFWTNYTEPVLPLEHYVQQFLQGVGPLASPGNNHGVAFYESQFTRGTGYPDIEIMFIPSNATTDLSQRAFRLTDQTYEDVWAYINRIQSFVLYIISLHSDSIGTVRLASKDPFEYPIIDNRFLSDPHGRDIERIYEGIQIMLDIAKTRAMKKLGTTIQGGPLRACSRHKYLTKAYWYCAIRQMTMNIYHPVGTCRMGPYPERGDVVDPECKVHGVKGLRISDASVFPFPLAGHPTAAVVLVGEMVSDFLKQEYLYGRY
ncbi:glucose dehydrogenase [FAD, quinone] [Leptinotarsa decemlineata]|uniref:glucose dehydrogenase [FAD, quinone] n=1 Tax=Leptinotarsa decemlineata TaxID=7539 RepID=UPI003D3071EF